ncbi:MAG: branched-chain amino acid ABC transporter substrate-binding protein [Candidatus Planktophila sp.]|nr:branched-chain amino acid ABC transporter substrate-binding protein [Candidatus Planktophila sp.]
MNKKIKASAAIVAAFALSLGAFAATSASAATKTYTLAYQGPLSGGEASTGIDEQNGVKYAIKVFEAANPGYKINLVSVDDEGDPAVASKVAPGVGTNRKIIGLVGPAYSGATIASLPYYKAGNLTVISPSATRVSLTDPKSATVKSDYGRPIFHRVVATDDKQGPALAKFAIKGLTAPKVFVFDDQSSYAVPLRGYVEAALKKIVGASIVGSGDSVPNTTTDFSPTIAKIKTAGATVVIYTGYYSQAAVFIKQLRDSGSTAVFAGGDGVFNQEFAKLAGKSGENARLTGVAGLSDVDPKLEADFKAKMGVSSGVYAVESIDAANIFLSGILNGKTTRAAINKWVKSYSGKGLGGTSLKFNQHGDISEGGFAGFLVTGGKLVNQGAVV